MKEALLQEACQAARHCAMVVLENATFILKELKNVHMPEPLRVQTERLCGALVGTKHDILSELHELQPKITHRTKAPEIWSRIDRMMQWLIDDCRELVDLVDKLDVGVENGEVTGGAYILVSESATNVMRAVDETQSTVKGLKALFAKIVGMSAEAFNEFLADFVAMSRPKQAAVLKSAETHLRFNELFQAAQQAAAVRGQNLTNEEAIALVQPVRTAGASQSSQKHQKSPSDSDWSIELRFGGGGHGQSWIVTEPPAGLTETQKADLDKSPRPDTPHHTTTVFHELFRKFRMDRPDLYRELFRNALTLTSKDRFVEFRDLLDAQTDARGEARLSNDAVFEELLVLCTSDAFRDETFLQELSNTGAGKFRQQLAEAMCVFPSNSIAGTWIKDMGTSSLIQDVKGLRDVIATVFKEYTDWE